MKYNELRVKIKSFTAETQIIKEEERKLRRKIKKLQAANISSTATVHRVKSLYHHRKVTPRENFNGKERNTLRFENRLSQLAYGFLRGKSYKQLEPNSTSFNMLWWNADHLKAMIIRFGGSELAAYKEGKFVHFWLHDQLRWDVKNKCFTNDFVEVPVYVEVLG